MKYFVAVLILFLFPQAHAQSSQVVAKIANEIVTSRKVLADSTIENNWTKPTSTKNMAVDSDEFNMELNRYLMERVVFLESKSFSLISVTDAEIKEKQKAVVSRIQSSSQNLWQRLEVTNSELSELIKQKIASQKFIEFKSKASYVPVTEAEAFNHYQNNKADYGAKEYKDIKESIKRSLAKAQAEQRLLDWYDILKKKYDVVKTISYISP